MPNLPRIRTRHAPTGMVPAAEQRPPIAELHQDGLTWIHLEAPTHREAQLLADRYGWHPLDVEDVLSRRQRPKVGQYLSAPLVGVRLERPRPHCPQLVQDVRRDDL